MSRRDFGWTRPGSRTHGSDVGVHHETGGPRRGDSARGGDAGLFVRCGSDRSDASGPGGMRPPRPAGVHCSAGAAALVLYRLDSAPAGKTYEAWVIRGKRAPVPAALFRGGGTIFVPIRAKVRKGSVVAVTVEPAGGSDAPTTKPFVVSQSV